MNNQSKPKIFITAFILGTAFLMGVSNNAYAQQPYGQGTPQDQSGYPVKQNESANEGLAKQAFEELVQNYQTEREQAFLGGVSDRYLREFVDLETNVDNDFREFDNIIIRYWIDDMESEGEGVSLSIHWERSWIPNNVPTPTPVLMKGMSKFVFEVKDGKAYLTDQQGDTLFGVNPM